MEKENFPKGPWTKNLEKFPVHFKEENILIFKSINEDVNKPNHLGYKMYKANKVKNILLHYDDKGNTYIKAKVHASMKRSVYNSGLFMDISGNVIWGRCNCVGGILGRCKHVFAILYQMLDYIRCEKTFIEDDVACTSKAAEWGKGSIALFETKPFDEFKFLKHDPTKPEKKTLQVLENRKSKLMVQMEAQVLDKNTLKEHASQLKENNLTFFHQVLQSHQFTPLPLNVPEIEGTDDDQLVLPLKIMWQQEFLEILNAQDLNKDVLKYCEINLEEAQNLEKETRTQSACGKWHLERAKRLTSSRFKEVIRRKAPINNQFLRRIWSKKNFQTAAMKIGLDNEQRAVDKYAAQNPSYKIFNCGLCVNPGLPFLAASPDRVVYDSEKNVYHLLEIKTLVKGGLIQNFNVKQCIERGLATYLTYDKTNGISLKPTHEYFFQIQGQMALTGLTSCQLLVDAGTDMFVQNIIFEEELWVASYLPALANFYFVHFEKSLTDL